MKDVQDWAMSRACQYVGRGYNAERVLSGKYSTDSAECLRAFARYIAEHEEPPVDPLLIEAREICKSFGLIQPISEEVNMVLASLKRGIHLGEKK